MENVVTRNVIFCEKQTEKAYLLKFESSKKVGWLPKSAVTIVDSKVNNMTGIEVFQVEIEKWAFDKINYLQHGK